MTDISAPTATCDEPPIDSVTLQALAATGVGDGWTCLSVGAGSGAVAGWLDERVAPHGHVVAADLEPHGLEPLTATDIAVLHHHVASTSIDDAGYHLIHVRLVLGRLPRPHALARKLVAALRPGGWLVVEDYDARTMAVADPPVRAWAAMSEAIVRRLRASGADPLFGGRALRLLRILGLADVAADAFARPLPVPALANFVYPTAERGCGELLRTGAIDEPALNEALAMLDDHRHPVVAFTPLLVATRGRRPAYCSVPARR